MTLLQLKLAATDTAAGSFSGLAAVFNEVDRQNDSIRPGAFAQTIAEWEARGFGIPVLRQHDQSTPIGSIYAMKETPDGLLVHGRLATTTPAGAEAHALALAGALSMSIGYTTPPGSTRVIDGVRYLSAVDLHEVSAVSVPAAAGAKFTEIKSAYDARTVREYEKHLRAALGLSQRDATAVAAKSWPIVSRRDGGHGQRDVAPDETVQKALAILAASNPHSR
jgi:HK97 family phage prohead protease